MRDNVLITGITGQVGSQLADYILENTVLNVVGMMPVSYTHLRAHET